MLRWQTWELTAIAAGLAWLANSVAVPYAGRVVRYTRATPDNIAARKDIRERGLALLDELHKKDYQRIIVVGHSLGSILAYDLVSYFWARRDASRTLVEGTAEFEAFPRPQQTLPAFENVRPVTRRSPHFVRRNRTSHGCFGSARRPRATSRMRDGSSPTSSRSARRLRTPTSFSPRARRTWTSGSCTGNFPSCPPVREVLDDWSLDAARKTDLPLDDTEPRLLCFPLGRDREWQLHHATPFAAVSWTNVHDPARLIFAGDIISGPLSARFGKGVRDVDLSALRGQSLCFSHTHYWRLSRSGLAGTDVRALREALDLSGQRLRIALVA